MGIRALEEKPNKPYRDAEKKANRLCERDQIYATRKALWKDGNGHKALWNRKKRADRYVLYVMCIVGPNMTKYDRPCKTKKRWANKHANRLSVLESDAKQLDY